MGFDNQWDVIIIGSGAGGGTLARKLAPSGKRILILERGTWVPREKDNWDSQAVNVDGKYQTKEVWQDRDGNDLHPHTNYCVGGNTKFYGAALFRLRERDFGELRHFGGMSPAWPLDYSEMEPWYTEAETIYQVRGRRGEDPTEPSASSDYLYPPISHEPRIRQLSEDFQRLGLRPFHTPLGVRMNEPEPVNGEATAGQNGKGGNGFTPLKVLPGSPCIRCETCDGYPCLLNAKSDAQSCAVEPALRYPNVKILTDAMVERLEVSSGGREIKSLLVKHHGEVYRFSAQIVVVACGAINSAALLLRSACDSHPRGLANGSDVVGRHYMGHLNTVLLALSKCPNPTVFQKTLSVNDFYFGTSDWPWPMGHISFVGKTDAKTLRAGAPAFAPGWTLELMAKHSLDFWLTSEDLPDPNNRVSIGPGGRIVLSYQPNNEEGHQRLVSELKSLMQKQTKCPIHGDSCHQGIFARNIFAGKRIPLAGVAHQVGTIRFGKDPASSALNVNCRAHEVDNLYVVDGSFFVSSGAVNPALTIMANALRVGQHLLERFR
jgi:choline dehydrogenase-like flavoprotein